MTAGEGGSSLTDGGLACSLMTWAVRTLTDVETNMMSLVRVKELTDLEDEEGKLSSENAHKRKIPKENAGAGEGLESLLALPKARVAPLSDEALKGWPWRGDLSMKNLSMRYNEFSPLALKGINLTIPRGTTLGVVGRSGSGKVVSSAGRILCSFNSFVSRIHLVSLHQASRVFYL